MGESWELSRKVFDDLRNMLGDYAESIDYGLAFDWWTSIPERYKWDDLRIHAHVRSNLAEFCAIFQYSPRRNVTEWISNIHSPASSKRRHPNLSAHNLYEPMLVRIVNLMQPIEGIVTPILPSFVWL